MNDKSYFIVAILDDKGAKAIREFQKEIGIELDNLNDVPHITLASYEKEINITNLLEWVDEFSQKQKSIDFCLYSLAVPRTLFAIPLITKELYELHYNIHQKYDEYCKEYSKLTAGWFPHVSIAYNAEKIINEKMPIITNAFNSINTKLISLWVSCIENETLAVLGKFPLQE